MVTGGCETLELLTRVAFQPAHDVLGNLANSPTALEAARFGGESRIPTAAPGLVSTVTVSDENEPKGRDFGSRIPRYGKVGEFIVLGRVGLN